MPTIVACTRPAVVSTWRRELALQFARRRVADAFTAGAAAKEAGQCPILAHGDENYPSALWRAKADEARAMAENMASEDGKRWMDEIARLYDRLTRRSEKREAAQRAANWSPKGNDTSSEKA